MEDAASEISDWEVISAASACGDDDRDDVVVVSGGAGDVLPDHFTLDLASPDPDDAGFSAEGSWSEPEAARFKEYQREGLDEFDPISQEECPDLAAGFPGLQLQEGGADENRESSVREAAAACGDNCSAEGRQVDAIGLETQPENNVARSCVVLDLALQPTVHGVGEPLDSDAIQATDASPAPQSEVSENSSVPLEDIGVDACIETSRVEDSVTTDEVHGGEVEQNQGNDAYAGSGCDETDGEAKGDPLPLVQAPGAGEEVKPVVVWSRLPFKLLHYCAWNVKPVWSFSIAAALLGLVVLGRKMYRMKHKTRGVPQIKIAFDDKRATQYANRAARLNEAFLIARRVPMLRTSSGAMLPWSMVQER